MPAEILLEVHLFDENYDPDNVWNEHKFLYAYLHHITISDIIKAVETMGDGDFAQSEIESSWTFNDQLSALTDTLEQMGITDVIPPLPDVKHTGFTVRILY